MLHKTNLALAAILLLSACNSNSEPPAEPIAEGGEPSDAGFKLAALTDLGAVNYFAAELGQRDADYRLSSKGNFSARNIVLIDRETGQSTALLPDQSASVEAAYFLPAAAVNLQGFSEYKLNDRISSESPELPPAYYLIETRKNVDEGPRSSLFIGSMDDLTGEAIMSGATSFSRFWMLDDRRLVTIATVDRREMFTVIDMAERKVISSEPVTLQFANTADTP